MLIKRVFLHSNLLVAAVFWSALVMMFNTFITRMIIDQNEMKAWPTADGVVTLSEVRRDHGSDGVVYFHVLEYEYRVNGEPYTGAGLRFGESASNSKRRIAEETVQRYPVGERVTVYYNPTDPDETTLAPGVGPIEWLMTLFLTPFNIVMVGFWWSLFATVRSHNPSIHAGGRRVIEGDGWTRVRLAPLPPMAWALITALALSFVSVFILAFLIVSSSTPSPKPIGVAWVVIIVITCGVFAWRNYAISAGRSDLILDSGTGEISLPPAKKRRERLNMPATEVRSVIVEETETAKSSNSILNSTHEVSVTLGEGEAARREFVAGFLAKESAQSFADWLRERLKLGETEPELKG